MSDEFDWRGAIDEAICDLEKTPLSSYSALDLDRNRIAVAMPTELLDRLRVTREIDRRMTEAFLEATDAAIDAALGDLDNWQPIGMLTQQVAARRSDVPEEMLTSSDRNARAAEWWRSQRRAPAHKRIPR